MFRINKKHRAFYKVIVFGLLIAPFILIIYNSVSQTLGPDPQEALLHMTGIWSLKILVITLLITPLTWIARIKELVLFRRMLGLFAFFYGSLHVVVYLWFYIGFDTALLLEDIFKRPYITIGFSAFVIMFLLAATSNRFAMKSLGKKWVKLHWGMYPLSLLVIWHYYWSVKINVFWPVLYGLIVLTLLACRFKIVKSYIKN